MNIEKNAYVQLVYELRTKGADGPVVESCDMQRPLSFVFGAGRMIALFEKSIEGLKAGDKFAFPIPFAEGYGPRRPEIVVDLPKNIFVMNGTLREDLLQIGARVPMMGQDGRHLLGIVKDVTEDSVKMDFNHPLAGEDLYFSGEILEVREATVDELIGDQHRCGGGCGGCGGGCGDESEDGCGGGCGGCGGGCH